MAGSVEAGALGAGVGSVSALFIAGVVAADSIEGMGGMDDVGMLGMVDGVDDRSAAGCSTASFATLEVGVLNASGSGCTVSVEVG
jgi:hypothetical protein